MKKFDIQRFARRRIQVGDNLQEKTIYIDNFPVGYAKEAATFDSWDRFILMDGNDDMMALNYFAIGQLKDENGVSVLENQFGVLTYIGMPGVVDQYIYKGTYDGNIVTNETQLSEMTICSTWISQGSSVVKTIHDNISAYRYFYIEDSHVRPLKVGDEITTNTKFYFNIPDDIYNSLSGATNPIVLSGNDGFKINCIGNGSDQTLIRFSNAMGSTEEANIYDMVSGTLNTNKSMMQNITTMDSSWVGIVETADSAHPLYDMILVDETTLGNYIEPIELPSNIRRVQIGDNLFQKYIYSDFPWEFDDTIRGGGDLTIIDTIGHENSFYTILLPESGNSIIKTVNKDIEYYLYWRENSQDNSIFGKRRFFIGENDTEANKNNYTVTSLYLDGAWWGKGAYRNCYIEDLKIRPLQVGDRLVKNTKLYFNFPDNIYSYISTNISPFSSIFTVQGENSGYKAGLWAFNEDGLAATGEQKISLVKEGWSPVLKEIYFSENGDITFSLLNESIYILTEDLGEIDSISKSELSNYILVDTTTLGEAPLISTGTISYKNGGNWNKLLSLAQEQIPLKGSIMPGPIKWSAVNSTAECTDSKTLYFVFGEEEASPTYETLTAQAKGATYGDSIFGGSGSHTLVVKNSDSEQNEYPYTVSLNGSGFYTDLEFSVVTNKPFQLGITFSYGLDPSMSSNQVSLGATLLDLISYESFSFNTVVTGTEGVGQTYWFPTTSSSGTQLTFDWLKNANLRITSSVSEYGQACLSGDTKIKTLNNDIYISDLELGDKVIDKDNQETEITKIYNHKIDTVYQIHLDNDETIECSYDHKFLVDGGKATTAAQLKENDKLGQHTITSIDIINKELDVYEIKTESNTYTLANGIICECENI